MSFKFYLFIKSIQYTIKDKNIDEEKFQDRNLNDLYC